MSELIEYLKLLFSTDIVIYSFIVGVLISASAAALGVVLVLKKYSMIGDGLSHVSFAAVAVAVATGNSPMLFSIPVVMISAFFILRMSESSRIRGDAATAIFSTAALAVGAIASRGTNVDIESYLFGSITVGGTFNRVKNGFQIRIQIGICMGGSDHIGKKLARIDKISFCLDRIFFYFRSYDTVR